MNKQIELLKEYGITNYTIENGKITINGGLDLSSLQTAHKDLFKGITINGWLDLNSLQTAHKDLFKGLTLNGWLYLHSLQTAHKDLFKGLTINGSLYLNSLQTAHKDLFKGLTLNGWLYLHSLKTAHKDLFKGLTINGGLNLSSLKTAHKDLFKGLTINGGLGLHSLKTAHKDLFKGLTINGGLDLRSLQTAHKDLFKGLTINGWLDLSSLQTAHKDLFKGNKLEVGYNKDLNYAYFDGILSKVLKVSKHKDYIIYQTPFEFIAQKSNHTAHGKTIKKAIIDLEFKILAERFKKEPIQPDTEFSVKLYRLLTGACESGVQTWLTNNNIPYSLVDGEIVEDQPIKAKDLLPLLEATNAYGLDKFKQLYVKN